VRRRWSSRTCRREMVSTRLSELFCRHDEKSPATPKHAASHGGRAAAPMEDGGGNNAREEDGREVPVELAEVPSRTARSLGCCSPHQAVLARDEEGAVRVSRELGGESNRLKTMKRAWPQKNETQERLPGARRESGFCIWPAWLTSGSKESNTEVMRGARATHFGRNQTHPMLLTSKYHRHRIPNGPGPINGTRHDSKKHGPSPTRGTINSA
jgi:hypothetical protein